MTTFVYRDMTEAGKGRSTIEAVDRSAALRLLSQRGITPALLEELPERGEGVGARGTMVLRGRTLSRAAMASLVRELATALGAGLPLVTALRTIAKQGRDARQAAMLSALIEGVETGRSLADAQASWGRPFTELVINLTRAGEASGRLSEVLGQCADLLDRDLKLRRSLVGATLYPMFLMLLIVVAIIIIVTFIVPKVLKAVGGAVRELPWPTRVVQGMADFFGTYWWLVLPMAVVAWMAGVAIYRQPEARLKIDRALLRLPLLGALLKDVAVARFTRTLATVTAAGLPILSGLKITRGTLNNRAMEEVIDEVCEQVTAGRTIAEPMERSELFPPMLVQIVNLGERSGRLEELLAQAAKAFEERTEQSVKLFTTALPPFLVVIAAGCVGFIVLAIMLPMLELQDAAAR